MTWADGNYLHKQKIVIDHNQVSGDEVNFPVLVKKTKSYLADTSNGGNVESSNGYDIVFYDANEEVLLNHEIQRYVNTTGEIIMWVKIPALSSTVDTVFYIYYGRAGVTTDPSTTDTWDANFIAVYHMKDITTSTIKDSTSNGNNGTKPSANNPIQGTGKIGYAQDFSSDIINCGNDNVLDVTDLTVEVWFNAHSKGSSNYPRIADIGGGGRSSPWSVYARVSTNRISLNVNFGVGVVLTSEITFDWSGGSEFNTWIHGVWTFTSGTQTAYKNGDPGIFDNDIGVLNNLNNDLRIGNSDLLNRDWDGFIDELRISNIVRSANWLNTTYNSQNAPDTFITFIGESACGGCNTFLIIGDTYTVDLKMPQHNGEDNKISKDINRFNFWSGSYDVHDDGIKNQPLVLRGIEFASCDNEYVGMCFGECASFNLYFNMKFTNKFRFIMEMSNDNEEVTIYGLGDCMDATYIIKHFSFKTDTPRSRSWTMTLEKVK